MSENLDHSAQEQLDLVAQSRIGSEADRRIFAWSFVGFGISVGLAPVAVRASGAAGAVVWVVYAVLLVAFGILQSRASSMPLGTKRLTWPTAVASFVLVGAGIAVLATVSQPAWWVFVLVAAAAATPMVVAGLLIGRQAHP